MTVIQEQLRRAFPPYGPDLFNAYQDAFARPDARRDALTDQLEALPAAVPSRVDLDGDWVTIGRASDLTQERRAALNRILVNLKPWRKGPFDLFGIRIDSEWNSALKWRRVIPHIRPLAGRRVLDVGSSNGYYLLRMAAADPEVLLGIEPYPVYYFQYLALQHYLGLPNCHCLPIKLEALPRMDRWFDTIFCMGILYHRRSPMDTLAALKSMLSHDGQLILETLIIPGEEDKALFPRDRYGRMRNVFFIPTVRCLESWLLRSGFRSIHCADSTPTTVEEQRKTQWIDSDSLDTFLDPNDHRRTAEGYPAPIRAVIVAEP